MVDSEQVEEGGVQVVNLQFVFDGVVPVFIGRPVRLSSLDASPRQPHGEAKRVVVTAISRLGHGRPSEFSTPHDECLIEQPTCLEIGQQPRDRAIDRQGVFGMPFEQV